MQPKVSVVIPAFNEEKLLPRVLQSLQSQTYPKELIEIIVADNSSTDQTIAVGKANGATVYEYGKIQTSGAARMFGCTKATGDVLIFTDADCTAPPGWIEKIVHTFDSYPRVMLVGKILPDTKSFSGTIIFGFYDWFFRLSQWYGKPIGWGSNMAVLREAYMAVGGFNPNLSNTEDWDLMKRLQKKYGRKKIRYDSSIVVMTAVRKQNKPGIFLRYARDGVLNYVNVMILGRTTKATPMIIVR